MKNNMIQICGVTPKDHLPKCPSNYPCREISETHKLCIPCKKPNIYDIIQVLVNVCITKFKVITTPIGKKLVIEGIQNVKVLYTADNPCQDVHSAHFKIPFCTFILLKDKSKKIIDICTAVEYISVHPINCRSLFLSSIIFMCPIFKNDSNCDDSEDCKFNICNDNNKCDI